MIDDPPRRDPDRPYEPTPEEKSDFLVRLRAAAIQETSIPVRRYKDRNAIWLPQEGSQSRFMASPFFEVLYHGTRGPGKQVTLDTPILTDKGWVPAGKVTYNHLMVAQDGSFTHILGIFPHKDSPMRRVTFHDGAEVVVDAEHRWLALNDKVGYREGWKVRTTDQMMGTSCGYTIPFLDGPWLGLHEWAGPDPYMVGLLLGDGTMRSARVTLYSADEEIILHAVSLGWNRYQYENMCMRAGCPVDLETQWRDLLPRDLAKDKSVPRHLMNADPAARLAVLQGLMDSDGHCERGGKQGFCSNSEQLARDVAELAKSLGGFGSVRFEERPSTGIGTGARHSNGNRWRVGIRHNNKFVPFRLQRKVERLMVQKKFLTRGIKSIEPCGTADGVCFAVEHSSHVFVCADWVLTHNTDALIMSFVQHIGKGHGPAWRGILFRQTYPQLADVQAKTEKWFRQIFGRHAKFNRSKMSWEWDTGEVLLLRHIARPADYWNYHGHEYPWIGFEELCNWPTDECFTSMFACCRTSTVGVPRMVRATANPYGPGHNWVKDRFRLFANWWRPFLLTMDSVDSEGRLEPPRAAYHGHISENKILLTADPNYRQTIIAAASNPAMADAWLNGSWDIVAGGMFDDVWNPLHNVVAEFDVPWSWRVDRSFDWGSAAPFSVGWWAESDGSDLRLRNGRWRSTVRGDLFRIHEWYGWTGKPNQGVRMLAVDIAKGIVERELQWGLRAGSGERENIMVKAGPADNQIHDVENGVSTAMDMAKPVRVGNEMHRGISWTRADKRPGSVKNGLEQMRKMMRNAHPRDGRPREHPGLYVVEDCLQFIRTVPTLPRSEVDMDIVDKNAEKHACDETRYRIRFTGNRATSGTHVGMY